MISAATTGGRVGVIVQTALTVVALIFSVYMVYTTIYGPYRTTLVHLALFLGFSFTIYFLRNEGGARREPPALRAASWLCAICTWVAVTYILANLDRILASWGSSFLTTTDLVIGGLLVLVVLEAARRESAAFFILSVLGILYILFGNLIPGAMGHNGMSLPRFIYLTAYTAEGIFGFGLDVAANYLFMFMLLSAAMTETRTGDFIMNICNAFFGRHTGGSAKSAVVASAGLGTMVGSSIGNVATTGTFTIPLMKRNGMPAHKAAAIETVSSEGSQFLPPVMGAGAFIMADMTGIPYATIAFAALIPAILYFVSVFAVVHIESVRLGLRGLDPSEIPCWRQVLNDGWHLLIPPAVLFYLLIGKGYSPSYAGMAAILIAIAVAMLRASTRLSLRRFINILDDGARSAASIVALVAAIGFIQQALVTTGLAPRLTEILLSGTGGMMFMTLILSVVAATILGMGMPTPIAYVLLALFVAPALTAVGVPMLAAHLFLFYFAIKSGSTPPVAVVAVVAASIAKANWWKTAVWAFLYSVPGFAIAFMFVYSPALLMQGSWAAVVFSSAIGFIATITIAAALQGWCVWMLNPLERVLIGLGALGLIYADYISDGLGLVLIIAGLLLARFRNGKMAGTVAHN
ncbi:TRAP transporter fused permease subunit [Aurantimonas sp. DM33-3]|uniref:TRAP transporter permease n=1 Tax=Aurantimonas sp. DM33-3 TaxID=2766955 RepID=UPI0016523628|nr:TRAP transporter fused permease subunit [Aurantimonas sp. DM33-3]MBC6717739.1 TRAP transporter fused permease subunit [Aurantimonas sp. DM33-3]